MHNPCGDTSHPPRPPHIPSKNYVVYHPILQPYRRAHDPAHSPYMLTDAAAAAVAWLRRRRIRYLFLLLCSPLLLLLLCAALPFLCAAELCLRIRLWRKLLRRDSAAADRLRRCEEGFRVEEEQQEKSLLHRYLEDQLFLVGSMYECGDDDDDDHDNDDGEEEEEEEEASRIVEDVERLGSSTARNPLLR